MTILYVGTDGAKWGAGLGRRLTVSEHDNNNWQFDQRIAALETATGAGITGFGTTGPSGAPGSQFIVYMDDGSEFGPFDLPVATFNARGAYLAGASYAVNDCFYINAALYQVTWPHVAPTGFNAVANDGSGHFYYKKLIDMPAASLPTGGATSYNLRKKSGADFDYEWAPPLPAGGATGWIMAKKSSANFDAEWIDAPLLPPSGGTGYLLRKLSETSYDADWIDPASVIPPMASVVTGSTGIGTATLTAKDRAKYLITPTGDLTVGFTGSFLGNAEIVFKTTGSTAWTVTLPGVNQGMLSTGTVAGKTFVIAFIGDNSGVYEVSRTSAM